MMTCKEDAFRGMWERGSGVGEMWLTLRSASHGHGVDDGC